MTAKSLAFLIPEAPRAMGYNRIKVNTVPLVQHILFAPVGELLPSFKDIYKFFTLMGDGIPFPKSPLNDVWFHILAELRDEPALHSDTDVVHLWV